SFTRKQVDWQGSNNLYIHAARPFLSFAQDKSEVKTLREWNQFWGRMEPGSVEQSSIGLQFTAWCSLSSDDQLRAVRREVEGLCGRLGSAARGAGPDWDLVGPGEAYVRALERAAGKPNSELKRRPDPPAAGPFVVLRNRQEPRGHVSLKAALGAAQDGDTI